MHIKNISLATIYSKSENESGPNSSAQDQSRSDTWLLSWLLVIDSKPYILVNQWLNGELGIAVNQTTGVCDSLSLHAGLSCWCWATRAE